MWLALHGKYSPVGLKPDIRALLSTGLRDVLLGRHVIIKEPGP